MVFFACFGACTNTKQDNGTKRKNGSRAMSTACGGSSIFSAAASDENWQSMPDDVLQAMLAYLSPADVAVARLVCRHWRAMLSCYTPALTLPTSFLSVKTAKAVLRTTSAYFPSVNRVNLCHTAGWCDPVQARMDVEPLVREERRNVRLEPLAAAFTSLQQLCVSDATFTREPWSLQQLVWLPKLSNLSLAWDTGLWAPGQVLQEADALQPLFSMTQLTSLRLAKHAHLFLGEVPLGDSTLTAAAHLRALVHLDLAAVSATDQGFSAFADLTLLTELSLTGQIAVSLGVLGKVFAGTTNLQNLSLQGLLPCSKDLKRIALAYSGKQHAHSSSRRHSSRHFHPSSSSASPSSSMGSSFGGSLVSSHRSSRRNHSHSRGSSLQHQEQMQQPFRLSGGSWRSSRLWQQQEVRTAPTAAGLTVPSNRGVHALAAEAPHVVPGSSVSNSAGNSPGSSSSRSSAAGTGSPGSQNSSSSGRKSTSRGRFRSSDWTVVLLPLRRLQQLKLQSDMVFLGSCAALRSMGHVTHLEFHGAAKFLHHGPHLQPYAALPPSWLTQLARDASASAVAAATADYSSGRHAASILRAGGAWPGLVSLHVDNLQLADGFIQGVAQLANLKTLVVSGPCLLAAQQHGINPFASPHQSLQHRQLQAASAPGWRSAFGSSTDASAVSASVLSELPDLSSLSGEGFSKAKALEAGATHKVAPTDPAAVLAAALASLKLAPGPDGSISSSTTSSGSTVMTAVSNTTSSSSGSGSQRSVPLLNASGMRPQLQPPMVAALAAMQQQQQAGPMFRPVLDADVLTRLSPLSHLSKFELHLQQQLPCGLSMTPFALAHLSVTWAGLTSLSLNVPTPPLTAGAAAAVAAAGAAAAGGGAGVDSTNAVLQSAAGQLFVSLGYLQALKHLNLTLTDGANGLPVSDAPLPLSLASALSGGLPSTPEQPPGVPADSGEIYSSGSNAIAAAAAVAALPWNLLPVNLESLSLSGFIGVQADNIKALGAAAPHIRHLRLMYCQAPVSVLWALHRYMPDLATLVVKEDGLGGVSSSGVAAVASLTQLVSLGVTVEPGADVSVLGRLGKLRYLLLDGRSNTDIRGIKGLMHLHKLKTLVMPLLHLHHTNNTLLHTMQLALPQTHIMNVSRNFGQHHGCQWFKCFSAADREWWRQPAQPWTWHPTLDILP